MYRVTQSSENSYAWRRPQARRATGAARAVEYGLLSLLVIILVATGATLMGDRLHGVFFTVASAMEQPGASQRAVWFGQRTNRKGAPVEREVSGRLPAISSYLR
jgi:Flp pilus assembly pilin Flp